MLKTIGVAGALAVAMLASGSRPAHADFSACDSAFQAKDIHQKIDLYSSCLKRGGLQRSDVAGAFNNRGIAYEQLGETDKALQDFISASQYDPSWPDFRINRAEAEASKGQCAEAQADVGLALKLAPHRKTLLELRDRLAASCPIVSKPPS